MNLPFVKHQDSHEQREYFFVVEIGLGAAQVALWSVVNAKPQVLAIGNSVMWKNDNADSLVQAIDQSLSIACERGGTSADNQPSKMVLGLPAEWIELDKISPQKLGWLKILSEKLDLKPVGFVMEHEAIIRFIQLNEGVPATAILLLVWPDYLEITLVRLGKVVGTVLVRKSQNLTEDVVEGLARLPKVEILPSRIFLTGSGVDMEQARQLLLNYSWTTPSKKFSFLHFPKVEILPSDFGAKAIASSVGSEMAEMFEKEPTVEQKVPEIETPVSDFGFRTEDITNVHVVPVSPEQIWEPKEKGKPFNLSFLFVGILIFLLAIAGMGSLYFFVPKATISATVVSKTVSQNIELTVSSKADKLEVEKSILPVKILEAETKDEQTIPTSGSKLVGDKATGSVTIVNYLGSGRSFPEGTILSSSSGLKFLLDNAASVSGAIIGADLNLQPTKTTVKITASQIGSDYNLTANTGFKIGNYAQTETLAKNEGAFSGGTSRQVKSVAKEDILNLKNSLTEKLKNTAKSKILSQVEGGDELLVESLVLSVVSEDYDHKFDEPADNIKLSMLVKARVFSYKLSDLDQLVNYKIKSLLPDGYTSQQDLTKVFTIKQTDKESAKLSIKVTAVMWPEINSSEIPSKYTGKNIDTAVSEISKNIGIESVNIEVSPNLPFFDNRLPLRKNNIIFNLTSK